MTLRRQAGSERVPAAPVPGDGGHATITIDRLDRYNACRARTVDELVLSFKLAWGDDSVGTICLTGAGEKAFCTGGSDEAHSAKNPATADATTTLRTSGLRSASSSAAVSPSMIGSPIIVREP